MSAGGLGGHSNGLIGLATYDGKVVADGIAARVRFAELTGLLSESECEAERRRLEKLRSRSNGGVSPAKVKEKLRKVMWDKVGVEKDAAGLQLGARRHRGNPSRRAARHGELLHKARWQTTNGWMPSTS